VLFCSASRRCFAETVHQSPPCFSYVDFLTYGAGYAIHDICGDAGQMVNDLMID